DVTYLQGGKHSGWHMTSRMGSAPDCLDPGQSVVSNCARFGRATLPRSRAASCGVTRGCGSQGASFTGTTMYEGSEAPNSKQGGRVQTTCGGSAGASPSHKTVRPVSSK